MGAAWTATAWVLAVGGVLLLAWALWWDRARGRLRCRRCWYDLAGVVGGGGEEAGERPSGGRPYMCPECGREHRSLRAMRRTRRRWGWVVVGVLVLLGAHGARAVPRVQREGWGAAAPRIGLVLLLPFLSEEQGSGLSSPVLSPRASNASGLDRFVLGQVPNYGLFYGPSSEVDTGLGWLSRRLVFLFARFQDPDVITDGTTAKGVVTKSLVSQLVHGGKCYRFEADWAKRQATIEVDVARDFGPDETPMGAARIRRLLLGLYRVRFGAESSVYRGGSPSILRINGFMPMFRSAEEEREHWVRRFLWDDLHPVRAAYGGGRDARLPGHLLPKGVDRGDGTAVIDLRFTFYDYVGDDWSRAQDDTLWRPGAGVTTEVRYPLNPGRVIQPDATDALRRAIQSAFSARLGVEYDRGKDRWVPVVTITVRSGASSIPDDVVFGGELAVVGVASDPAARGETEYMRGSSGTFWAWGHERYAEPVLGPGKDRPEVMRLVLPQRSLRVRSRSVEALPGEMICNHWALGHGGDANQRLVLRMSHAPGSASLGGLWGDRVFHGELEFEIRHWTVGELRRYMVSGIVPDHAMP